MRIDVANGRAGNWLTLCTFAPCVLWRAVALPVQQPSCHGVHKVLEKLDFLGKPPRAIGQWARGVRRGALLGGRGRARCRRWADGCAGRPTEL